MKKIYLSLALVGLATTGLFAQQTASTFAELGPVTKKQRTGKPTNDATAVAKAIVWTESFDIGSTSGGTGGGTYTTSNGDWVASGNIWKHDFETTNGEWSTGTSPFASTTASDGFMLFDSDSVNLTVAQGDQSLYSPYSGDLVSPTIDLSAEGSVVLEFEQDFRYCCTGSHEINVSVSNDGGASWGTPHDVTGGVATNDDYFTTNGDSYKMVVNITAEAANQANVKLKFTWDGNLSGSSHYYWNFDDVCLYPLPDNDVQILSSWIAGENNEGVEYGRCPEDQQETNYLVGSEVYNFGALDQTAVTWGADFNSMAYVSTGVEPSLLSQDTVIIENAEAWALPVGMYNGDYGVVSSGEDATSPLFGNNVGMREFEITTSSAAATPMSSIYSIDGVGVYAANTLSSTGTNSFTGGEDGLICGNLYHIKNTTTISGIRVMLATGTVSGAELYGSIKDTATYFADDMTSMYVTGQGIVSAGDIGAGYIDLYFAAPVSVNAGGIIAAVEMYSNGNSTDVRILDDETVAQPWYASTIYIPGDVVYSNGEAFGIRLLMGSEWGAGINENTLTGISVYPNPTQGVVTISNENGTATTIAVHDLAGKLILTTEASATTTIDLSENGTGVYLVEVSNGDSKFVERVIVK